METFVLRKEGGLDPPPFWVELFHVQDNERAACLLSSEQNGIECLQRKLNMQKSKIYILVELQKALHVCIVYGAIKLMPVQPKQKKREMA